MSKTCDESALFKKKNTFWKLLWKILCAIGNLFVAIIVFVFENFIGFSILGILIFCGFKMVSCIHEESEGQEQYMHVVDSCKSLVDAQYGYHKNFTYDVKGYIEDDSKFRVTTVHNGIVNTFVINRHNIIIHENKNEKKAYARIYAKRFKGEICEWSASSDYIDYAEHRQDSYQSTKIPWGLRDKKPNNVIVGVWDDNDIWFDITSIVKNDGLRLQNDTDATFKRRHYYLLYIINKIDLYVPDYTTKTTAATQYVETSLNPETHKYEPKICTP